jgi:hypothetical protein
MGIEIDIAGAHAELTEALHSALNDEASIAKAGGCLEGYYKLEKGALSG